MINFNADLKTFLVTNLEDQVNLWQSTGFLHEYVKKSVRNHNI